MAGVYGAYRMQERCIQGLDRETGGKETTSNI